MSLYRTPPTVQIEPERQTVPQGTVGELRCIATGDPTPIIRWSKAGEDLPSNVYVSNKLNEQNSTYGMRQPIALVQNTMSIIQKEKYNFFS